jgi:uncharacterized protein YdcH (DUF465 family)
MFGARRENSWREEFGCATRGGEKEPNMSEHLDIVLSRFRNMLTRIMTKDSGFEDLCSQHADLTSKIRRLDPSGDLGVASQDENLRRRRAALEDQMFAIMQSNTRV